MKKLIIAVSTFILTVPAFVKVSLRSNYPGRVRSLERPINPRSLLFVVAIVLVVAGCATARGTGSKDTDLGEEATLILSLGESGNITKAKRPDGKLLEFYDDKTFNSDKNWIATIGACWRKVEGQWGLQRTCGTSGDKGQTSELRVTIDGTGKITTVTDINRNPLVYKDSNETMENSKIVGFNHWCWRKVRGRWRCKHSYC